MIRCKFRCEQIIVDPNKETAQVYMYPVVYGSKENEEFFKYTPGGNLILHVVNPRAIEELKIGSQYYIDITEATDEV